MSGLMERNQLSISCQWTIQKIAVDTETACGGLVQQRTEVESTAIGSLSIRAITRFLGQYIGGPAAVHKVVGAGATLYCRGHS